MLETLQGVEKIFSSIFAFITVIIMSIIYNEFNRALCEHAVSKV